MYVTYRTNSPHERKAAKEERAKRKLLRREIRAIEKADRLARGETGAPVDWSLAVNATVDTPYEGLARTLARGD